MSISIKKVRVKGRPSKTAPPPLFTRRLSLSLPLTLLPTRHYSRRSEKQTYPTHRLLIIHVTKASFFLN